MVFLYFLMKEITKLSALGNKVNDINIRIFKAITTIKKALHSLLNCTMPSKTTYFIYLSSKMFIISQAALATLVPGPKMAATPAL